MGQQMGEGDRFEIGVFYLEEIEILVHVVVQVNQAPLGQLHHSRTGEQLADGTGAKDRLLRDDGRLVLQVSVAVALGKESLTILYQDKDRAGDVVLGHLFDEKGIREGFHFLRIGGTLRVYPLRQSRQPG